MAQAELNTRPLLGVMGVLVLVLVVACGPEPTDQALDDGAAPKLLTNDLDMSFQRIAAGSFRMGSPADEAHRDVDEIAHDVSVDAFYMATTEVTQAQWEAVMGTNPSKFKGPKLPVDSVSRADAIAFAQKLSERDGRRYRLPTEAEWEYACRAGASKAYGSASVLTSARANIRENKADSAGSGLKPTWRQTTTPVGSFTPNAWGLHDMHGNVWEWTSDGYSPYDAVQLPGAPSEPTGDGVLRGGAWNFSPSAARCATRFRLKPAAAYDCNGFRLVAEASAVDK